MTFIFCTFHFIDFTILENYSFVPTPIQAVIGDEEEEDDEEEAVVHDIDIELKKKARIDAQRYANLFKKHALANNSHYGIHVTGREISIEWKRGSNVGVLLYPYTVGHAKALYCLLSMVNYNLDALINHVSANGFVPFPEAEYVQAQVTPEPQEKVKAQLKFVNGKWGGKE